MGRDANSKWHVLVLVSLSFFFANAERLCLPVLFEEIIQDLHMSLVQVGAVWGIDPLGGILVSLFSGLLIDRFGVKRTITVIIFFCGVFGILRSQAVGFKSLLFANFLFGLLVATTPTVLPKVVALWFRGRHLGTVNGIITTVNCSGGMFASITSATLFSPLLGGWRNVLILYGLPPIVLSFLWLLSYREPREKISPDIHQNRTSFQQALSHVVRIRGVWIIGVLQFGAFGAYTGVLGYLPLYLRGIGWNPLLADSAVMVLIGAMGACAIPISLLSDRLRSRTNILFILLIGLGASLCLLPWVKGFGIWLLVVVSGLMIGGMVPTTMATIMELKGVGSRYVGTAFGMGASFSMVGAVISPPLGNSIAQFHTGLPFVFWGIMAGGATVALLFMRDSATEAQ